MTTTDDHAADPPDTATLALRCGDLRAERDEARAERDTIRSVALEMLGQFYEKGHPGRSCLRTPWVPVERIATWHDALVIGTNGSDRAAEPLSGLARTNGPPDDVEPPATRSDVSDGIDERDAGTREREAQDG